MASPRSTVLSMHAVSLSGARGAAAARAFDFELGHREVALVEVNDDADAHHFVDVCLGLIEPAGGEVWCLGRRWAGQGYHAMLAQRSRIGTLVNSQAWPGYVPVGQVVLTPRLYHTRERDDAIVAEATVLGRRFGMPGVPVGGPETVRLRDLVRAACVTAFLGTPELVVIADRTLDGIPEFAMAMAQAVGEVQDRGGAVLWLVGSFAAPAARFVAADQALRLRDRGLSPVRRQR
jgi:phospholipid/cholesterol/gamma-HCH transport system ATP-binding protein